MFISLFLKNGLVQASSILISCPLFGARRSEVAIRFFTGLALSFPDLIGALKIVPGIPPGGAWRLSVYSASQVAFHVITRSLLTVRSVSLHSSRGFRSPVTLA
ncbi:hypothetical protein, partial [Candidatus Propionivibrio aalborgensis]|uniref:hypothetical protein n=1 Tax=Candidatus Propionivibrio aalborgensis TaxID=1860101 RepID=UPI001C915D28